MSAKRLFAALVSSLLLISSSSLTASAEVALPDGAVKGLPEKLTAMDSEGAVVDSATGEYFFHVENMQYGEVYTKDVQLMNLRDDKAYHIYFYVEPIFKTARSILKTAVTVRSGWTARSFTRALSQATEILISLMKSMTAATMNPVTATY